MSDEIKISNDRDRLHLETLYNQTKAFSDEEQRIVAKALKTQILLEALELEFDRLRKFEAEICNLISQ